MIIDMNSLELHKRSVKVHIGVTDTNKTKHLITTLNKVKASGFIMSVKMDLAFTAIEIWFTDYS